MGANGMVASAHTLATLAGVHVLLEGGNAFDAAVTVGSTLGVVEPHMSGIGGIGVALAYVASEKRVRALDFSGRAPLASEPALFTHETREVGPKAWLVPGTVAGWLTLHEKHGVMDRERLFAPAIEYADKGTPLSSLSSHVIDESAERVKLFDASAAILLASGHAPGSLLKMPALADSMREVASGGRDAFYRGELAGRIARGSQEGGGLLAEEDLAGYEAEWLDPVSIDYRGYQVFTPPPNSGGFQILQTLKLMEGFDPSETTFHNPETTHLLIEAIKLSSTDRVTHSGDSGQVKVPLEKLLSSEYAAAQRGRISRDSAAVLSGVRYRPEARGGAIGAGTQWESVNGETTHFVVADRLGNVVSVTQTLGAFFGSGAAVGDTGIFMNDGCEWFDEVGGPNPIGPGKKVGFVLAPTQTLLDGHFYMSIGTTGGYGINQTTPQMLMNVLDHGMDVQQAIDRHRFSVSGGLNLNVEEGFPANVRRDLLRRGHRITMFDPYPMGLGSAHGILVDPDTGVYHGGGDPRRDGLALGW